MQDIALLQGQPAHSYVAQSAQEQVGQPQPLRRFGRRGHQQFLDRRTWIFVFFHIVNPSLRRARILFAVGERQAGCAHDAKAAEKGADRHEWPGDEARKTGAEQ